MTLKKFNQLLEESKKDTFEKIKENPDNVHYAINYFEGYFMMDLLNEIFKSKNEKINLNKYDAFEAWANIKHQIKNLEFKENFTNIVKQFLNRR